jgi:hypothetical protein
MTFNELITTTELTEPTEQNPLNALTHTIIGAAIEVHRALGPGLLEVDCVIIVRKFSTHKILRKMDV